MTVTRLGAPVAYLLDHAGGVYPLGYTPEQAQLGGEGWTWQDVARQGLKPVSYPDSQRLRTLSFTHDVTAAAGGDKLIHGFRHLFNAGGPVRLVNVSQHERGWWRISDLQVTITARTDTQEMRTATCTWTLTEYVKDDTPKVGRSVVYSTAGGVKNLPPYYTAASGETLYSIATKLYGDGSKWVAIAKLNGLTSPNVVQGQFLKIPPLSSFIGNFGYVKP